MRKSKDIEWLGDSKTIIRGFPEDIRADLGADLMRLQCGLLPNNWKPFHGLRKNAFELRAKDDSGIYRAIYVTFVKDKIYILHCFQKKSAKTSRIDIDKANQRLNELMVQARNKK